MRKSRKDKGEIMTEEEINRWLVRGRERKKIKEKKK